jgi:hypothetical protein
MDLPDSDLDILTISETWLHTNIEAKLTSLRGYNLIRHDRKVLQINGQAKTGGGLGVYYKDKLQIETTKYHNLNISNKYIEIQWVAIKRPHTKPILIGNVYRPPDGNPIEAVEQLHNRMEQIININKYELLLIGDFNLNYND